MMNKLWSSIKFPLPAFEFSNVSEGGGEKRKVLLCIFTAFQRTFVCFYRLNIFFHCSEEKCMNIFLCHVSTIFFLWTSLMKISLTYTGNMDVSKYESHSLNFRGRHAAKFSFLFIEVIYFFVKWRKLVQKSIDNLNSYFQNHFAFG